MNRTTLLASAIAVLCLAGPIVGFAGTDAEGDYSYIATDVQAFDIDNIADVDYRSVIDLDEITSDEFVTSISEIDTDSTMIVSDQRLTLYTEDNIATLKNTIESGIPLIVSGDSNVVQNIGVSVVVNPDASYSAVYCDPISKIIYCYGIESSEPIAEDAVMAWVNSVRSATSVESDIDFGDAIFYQETKICDGDRARINATALYSKLGSSNGFTYYAIQYNCEAVVNDNDWRVADITVSCDVDKNSSFQNLIDYGPDSTNTETTSSVSVSMSAGTDISVEASVGWSYTVPSTIIHNQCDTSEDYFNIWHDVNENIIDDRTVRVKPGMIVSTNSSVYSSTDVFEVKFRGPYYDKFWPWDPTTELKTFTLECNALLSI